MAEKQVLYTIDAFFNCVGCVIAILNATFYLSYDDEVAASNAFCDLMMSTGYIGYSIIEFVIVVGYFTAVPMPKSLELLYSLFGLACLVTSCVVLFNIEVTNENKQSLETKMVFVVLGIINWSANILVSLFRYFRTKPKLFCRFRIIAT